MELFKILLTRYIQLFDNNAREIHNNAHHPRPHERIGIRMIVKQDKSKVGDNTKIRTKHHAFEI